jgi:hypothetical protein
LKQPSKAEVLSWRKPLRRQFMAQAQAAPFNFPSELERLILELASLSRPVEIPNYMLVAWRVRKWYLSRLHLCVSHLTVVIRVEPLLYRTLAVGVAPIDELPPCSAAAFITIARTKPAWIRNSVRNLYIGQGFEGSSNAVLSEFPRVENLWLSKALAKNVPDAVFAMPLRHLYLNLQYLFRGRDLTDLLFPTITHLEVWGGLKGGEDEETVRSRLAAFPSLTHLAFNELERLPLCVNLLQASQSLRAVIVLEITPEPGPSELEILAADPRFVMMYVHPYNFVDDWWTGVLTGEDYWARADAFIAKRKSGEIDRESPLIFNSYPSLKGSVSSGRNFYLENPTSLTA